MFERARAIYRQSKKPQDNFWNTWVSRPPAAVVVGLLETTHVTPNQVTFSSLAVFAGAVAVLIAARTHAGLLAAALLVQASYILDCVDGQLARYKGLASPVGALLDFLMDELKAFLLVAGAAVRLWLLRGDPVWLVLGIGGLVAVASGIALTSFMRRAEYQAATSTGSGQAQAEAGRARSPTARAIALVEAGGHFVVHYPSWFLYVAIFDVLDLFLLVYLGAHVLYLGRSALIVLVKLGRPMRARPAPADVAGEAAPR